MAEADDDIGEVGESMMRMSVNTSRMGREAMGITTYTFLMAREHRIVGAAKQSLKEYSTAVKGNKKHDKGPPHLHVGASIFQALVATPVPDDAAPQVHHMMKSLKIWTENILKESAEVCLLNLRHAQVADTYDKPDSPKLSKIIVAFEGILLIPTGNGTEMIPMTVNEVVGRLMMTVGTGSFKGGPAPASPAERTVRQQMRALMRR